MTKQTMFFTIIVVTLILATTPSFAQGRGAGLGVGSQIGVGGNARVQAPGVKADASTDVDAKAKTSADVKDPGDKGQGRTDFVTRIEANPRLSAKLQALLPFGETLSQAAAGFK